VVVANDNKTQASSEGLMETLLLPFSPRFIILTICAVVTATLIGIGIADRKIFDILLIPIVIFGALTLLGVRDLMQKGHAVLRNYPISAHIRFLLEEIRPEMRQYFFESEKDGMPFSRDIRAVVYQRAKMQLDKRPFGTQEDVYREGYEWMHHSVSPKAHAEEKYRITIGGPDCAKPYSASVFNISAMSFGALSPNAVRALNAGAKKGGFAHDTGEGGFSPYHREMGGDIIWEIGSGYFGCRHLDGSFDPEAFARVASQDQIKMVELKISQGAKPGHGGVLPAAKVSEEISKIRGVAMGEDCISPASHRAFSTPTGMMQFIAEMRKLSGGKPTGFKLCIGHPWEFLAICKAMLETGIYPDFIVVDGNVAAVNYVLQGENKGPYGQLPPSGNRIEAMSGEVFEFNPEGLMKKLTTITEIDRVESEIKGTTKINAFQKITLLPTSEENSEYRAKIRSVAARLHENFDSGKNDVNGALATEDIRINADSRMLRGRQALIDLLKLLKTAFPDMNIRDEYVLADGNRAAVEYVMEGTQTGPYTLPDGSVLPASGRKVRVRGIEFMEFDKAALLKELVVVHNEHDFATQLSR